MSDTQIKVDTGLLREYASRLKKVNSRLKALEGDLEALYRREGLVDIGAVLRSGDIGWSKTIDGAATYLLETAEDFENVEKEICDMLARSMQGEHPFAYFDDGRKPWTIAGGLSQLDGKEEILSPRKDSRMITADELAALSPEEFVALLPAQYRRSETPMTGSHKLTVEDMGPAFGRVMSVEIGFVDGVAGWAIALQNMNRNTYKDDGMKYYNEMEDALHQKYPGAFLTGEIAGVGATFFLYGPVSEAENALAASRKVAPEAIESIAGRQFGKQTFRGASVAERTAADEAAVEALTLREGYRAVVGKSISEVGEVAGNADNSYIQFNIDRIRSLLKTDTNTAFFWSGRTDGIGGAEVAADIAKRKGGVTLETIIESRDIVMPEWDFSNPSSMEAWNLASGTYAEQVTGEVRAVIGSNLREGNIWENVELPRLKNNVNINKITVIDPKTGLETVVFERK